MRRFRRGNWETHQHIMKRTEHAVDRIYICNDIKRARMSVLLRLTSGRERPSICNGAQRSASCSTGTNRCGKRDRCTGWTVRGPLWEGGETVGHGYDGVGLHDMRWSFVRATLQMFQIRLSSAT